MFSLADAAGKVANDTADMAQTVGVSVEALEGLTYGAKMTTTSVEAMTNGLRLLSKNAMAAAQGGQAQAEAFSKVGVSLTGANGKLKTADELMMDVADKFEAMPDGMQKTASAMALFGRSGAALIPMLNEGKKKLREYSEEGVALSAVNESLIAKSELLAFAQTRFHASLENLKTTIGGAVMPAVTELLGKFNEWYMLNKDNITQQLGDALNALVPVLRVSASALLTMVEAGTFLVNMVGGGANAVKLLTGALVGLFAMGVVANFTKIVEAVVLLKNAVMALALWEGVATGGMSLLIGAGAAGLTYAAMSSMEQGGDQFKSTGGRSAGAKYTTNNFNVAPTVNVDARGQRRSSAAATHDGVTQAMRDSWARTAAAAAGANN
jgi:hypothetical protein